ncbi:MAG: choice-of-anchor B family protein [Chitinophagales bacterium]|nr:choice-of-anchor B family protein [Chitinophagales bacterium]
MSKNLLFFLLLITGFLPANTRAQLNVQQLGHLTYSENLAALWGYTDATGHEYALVGSYSGLSIVDLGDPAHPKQVQLVSTQKSEWHEVKVYSHYAYCVNESGGGLLIVDLANLPNTVTSVKYTGGTLGLSTGHSIWIDEKGFAYINGSNVGSGGVVFLDLKTDPMNPTYAGQYNQGYVHDCYAKNDTMWAAQIYNGYFRVVNVASKTNPQVLAQQTTPGAFTHNCWPTDNSRYVFTTDEVSNSSVTSYDESDLSNISEPLDQFQANPGTSSIAHNVRVKGKYLVIAYYRDGVILADATQPDNIIKVGNYDTSPYSGNGYNGCWDAYPFFASGNIIASDIEQGLFVLKPTYVPACYLRGIVTDYATGSPLNGVTVQITGADNTDNTDLSGNYATGYSVAGKYTVTFTKSGYYTKTFKKVNLSNGVTTILNLTMKSTSLPLCTTPVNLNATVLNPGSIDLSWSDESATKYTVKVKDIGTNITQTYTATTNSINVSLSACSVYEFKVRSKCPDGTTSSYSGWYSFSGGGNNCRTYEDLNEANPEEGTIYPNPFSNDFTINFSLQKKDHIIISLWDVSGKKLQTIVNEVADEGVHSVQVNNNSLSSGIYFCTIQSSTSIITKKIFKN